MRRKKKENERKEIIGGKNISCRMFSSIDQGDSDSSSKGIKKKVTNLKRNKIMDRIKIDRR